MKIFSCRRSIVSIIGMLILMVIALVNKTDVSLAIAGIVSALSASNSYQAVGTHKKEIDNGGA